MTTDERLAALEAKMDALTAPPSDYYTSRYSGEEIDAAIAAVPGKAEAAQLCNRNLLDNWYFGNPVDQRGGHYIPKGGTYYTDAACTTAGGTMSGNYNVVPVSSTTYKYTQASGNILYFKAADVVRGYVGAGYTVDRWKLFGSAHVVTIESGSITLRKSANTADFVYAQYFEGATLEFLRGKTATISAMDSNGNVYSKTLLIPASGMFDSDNLYIGDNWWIDLTVLPSGDFYIRFVSITKAETTLGIQAAKLELGSQQTLAHQDADGNWVLNEVPDYGEQLKRCQRYYYQASYVQYQTINMAYEDTAYAFILLPLPVEMRLKNPVLTQSAPIALGSSEKTLVGAEATGCMARLGINYSAIANAVKSCYSYCPSAEGVTFSLSADL